MSSFSKNMLLTIVFSLFAFSAYVSAAATLKYGLVPANDYSKIPQLTKARDFGVNFVLNNGIKGGKLANTTYTRVSINSVYNATNGTNVYYKFNLTYNNSKGDIVKPQFVVQFNTKTKAQLLKSSSYTVRYGGSVPCNPTNPTTPTIPSNPPKSNNSNNTNGGSSNPTNSFVQVPVSKYNDSIIHSSLMYGVNFVANYAIAKGSLPKTTYQIIATNSIYQQKVTIATNYKYDVMIQDLNKTRTAQTLFTVRYQQVTGVKSMVSYSYKVLPYST